MQWTIRYARAIDGVNIAFCEFGRGEPVIFLPSFPWCNFSVGYANPLTSSHPMEIAERVRLITYDARGCGLSDHDAFDLTLDGMALDIDAIAESLGLSRFALYGAAEATRVMAHYAATRPERVSRLILWLPTANAVELRTDPRVHALNGLMERDWEMYVQTVAHAVVGGWDMERAPYAAAWANLMRASVSAAEFARVRIALRGHDASADLERIAAPTLVITRHDAAVYRLPVVRTIADRIPNARLVVAPGIWLLPCTDTTVSEAVVEFMQESPEGRAPAQLEWNHPATGFPNGGAPAPLSPREREVVALMAAGKTNAQIAGSLVVSPATASRHVHNILTKLGMSRRSEAVAYAVSEGLVTLEDLLQRPVATA